MLFRTDFNLCVTQHYRLYHSCTRNAPARTGPAHAMFKSLTVSRPPRGEVCTIE